MKNAQCVQSVVRDALDKAIPDAYKPSTVVGQRGFGNRTARQVLEDLYTRYGFVSPDDIHRLVTAIYKPWNPADPIEDMLHNIETQQVFAINTNQIQAALGAIPNTKLFKDELKEFNYTYPNITQVQWAVFKPFWLDAYAKWDRDRERCKTQATMECIMLRTTTSAWLLSYRPSLCSKPKNLKPILRFKV